MSRVLAIDGRPTNRFAGIVFFVVSALLALSVAPGAQADGPRRLMILRGGAPGVDVALRDETDQALVESVTSRPAFSSVEVSPIPFEDVELAAGCSSRDAECLQRIAATLEADWLMVRELARDHDGNVYLTLIAHDGSAARVTRRAVAEVADDSRTSPARVVPLLVERLYPAESVAATPAPMPDILSGTPAPELPPITAAPRERREKEKRWATLSIVGASALAAGAVTMTAGVTLWALSQRDARDYHRMKIRSTTDVDRALELHDRAKVRASAGRGLLIGGTLAAVAGSVALLWVPFRQGREPRRVAVHVAPDRDGFGVGLAGAWRGGL